MCRVMIIIACRSNMTKSMFSVFRTIISILGNGLNASRMILCALWWSSLHTLDGGVLKQIWTSFWKTTLLSPWIHIVYRETINLKMLVVCSTNGFGYCTWQGGVGLVDYVEWFKMIRQISWFFFVKIIHLINSSVC